MEADIAAIKGYVEQLVWCGMVAAVMLPTLGGMYLFRLTVLAKDRAHKKILGFAAAMLVGNQAFAVCDCGSWGGFCPLRAGMSGYPAVVNEWVCQDVGITDATTQCIDGTNVACKKFRVDYRGRRTPGVNQANDVIASWVMFFEKGVTPARKTSYLFWHYANINIGVPDDDDSNGIEDYWNWSEGFPGCAGCSTCNDACPKCLNCVVTQAVVDGLVTGWNQGVTTTEMAEWVLLRRCNFQVGPCTCGTLLCDGPDGDTLADHVCDELPRDTDGDGDPDATDPDDDNDGVPDQQDPDDDGDGLPDQNDPDHDGDGDGIPDQQDPDDDGDGIPDQQDPDDDGDGIPDDEDPDHPPQDEDGDGIPDVDDPDDDGDGIPDVDDPDHDSDGDGIPDPEDPDDNNNGIPDDEEGPDDPGGEDPEDPGPDVEHAECTDLTTVLKSIGLKILGFDGVLQEDVMETWETNAGEGLKIPWLKPQSFRLSEWTVDEIVISPTGLITVPGGTPYQWRNWGTMSEYILTGIKAVLLLMYCKAFFELVMGGG